MSGANDGNDKKDQRSRFMTVSNMQLCENVFGEYMYDKHGMDVSHDVNRLKKVLFAMMRQTDQRYGHDPSRSLRNLNDITLSAARNVFLHQRKEKDERQQQQQRPTQRQHQHQHVKKTGQGPTSSTVASTPTDVISRERAVYGNRPIALPPMSDRPEMTKSESVEVMGDTFNRLLAERDENIGQQQPSQQQQPSTAMMTLPTEEMDQRMTDEECVAQMNDMMNYRNGDAPYLPLQPRMDQGCVDHASAEGVVQPTDFLVEDDKIKTDTTIRFLLLNGADRDLAKEPNRYSYTVRTVNGGLLSAYKDVVAIQASWIVIPNDIPASLSEAQPTNASDRATYQHEFGFSYPYLILSIEGFEDVYDGTNEPARRAFCIFLYQRSYRTHNGRGYVVLETMQDDIKRFAPTPLASLRDLSVTIRKPNGTLFNDSRDDRQLYKVEYEDFNRYYLKIVLDKYFDRNEYYVGDTIRFREARFRPHADADFDHLDALARLENFLNREEGHAVIQIGAPNESGYFRTFHLYAPGEFDKDRGLLVLHADQIDALRLHNDRAAELTASGTIIGSGTTSGSSDGGEWQTGGYVMNAALQSSIGMRVWQLRADMTPQLQHLNRLSSQLKSSKGRSQENEYTTSPPHVQVNGREGSMTSTPLSALSTQ